MSRPRFRPAALVATTGLLLATAAAAQAQAVPAPESPAPITAPSTTGPAAPPTTSFLGLFPGTTATTAPVRGPVKLVPTTTAPPTTKAGAAAPAAPTAGDAEPPPGASKAVPADAQRQIDSVRRTAPNSTTAWLAAIQPLVTELGMSPADAAIAGGVHFPVAGPTTWSDDWLNPRFVPTFHLHKGLDMFAAMGTPVRAPFDGSLKFTDGAVGGLAAYVTMADGTYVYMAHLSGFAPGKANGQRVRQGEVVGFVGDSGDARGGAPHVHLQLHPKGGDPVPPKPTIDAWLAEATAAAPQLITATRAARNPATATEPGASVTAVSDDSARSTLEATIELDPASALWAASSNPAIGTIDLASSLVALAADAITWPAPPNG